MAYFKKDRGVCVEGFPNMRMREWLLIKLIRARLDEDFQHFCHI